MDSGHVDIDRIDTGQKTFNNDHNVTGDIVTRGHRQQVYVLCVFHVSAVNKFHVSLCVLYFKEYHDHMTYHWPQQTINVHTVKEI